MFIGDFFSKYKVKDVMSTLVQTRKSSCVNARGIPPAPHNRSGSVLVGLEGEEVGGYPCPDRGRGRGRRGTCPGQGEARGVVPKTRKGNPSPPPLSRHTLVKT